MIKLNYLLITGTSIVNGWTVQGFFPSVAEAKTYAEEMKLNNIHIYKIASDDLVEA